MGRVAPSLHRIEHKGEHMALETLRDVKEIGGFEITQTAEGEKLLKFHKNCYIYVNHNTNSISFTLQNGPIKEVGKNGVQVETMIEAAKLILVGLNNNFPCFENATAILKLDAALDALAARKKNREERGVEGKDEA
jgi:hypothetical protein